MRRSKLILFRCLTVLVSIGIVLVLAEIVIRANEAPHNVADVSLDERLARSEAKRLAAGAAPLSLAGLVERSDQADIVYRLKPNQSGTFLGVPLRTNARGMRDAAYPLKKPAGTFRIVGIGDSVMFGWGVDAEASYLAVLEQRLNASLASSPRFEVLNFAVPGYNTTMEVATFEHVALAFDPDLVVIQFVNNDFSVPHFMLRPEAHRGWSRSALMRLVASRLGSLKRDPMVHQQMEGLDEGEKSHVLDQYRHMLGEAGYRQAMGRLAARARAQGCPVIVLLGSSSAAQRRLIDALVKEHEFHLVEVGPYTNAYIDRHGIPNTPAERRKAIWLSRTDRHPNAAAHTIYTDALMDALRDVGVVPAGE
ncbi:MAG: SGNH/GDSL hydrolase family protein [Verrucomicrobia bacterium]|jgi:hypothetical protein|nr:SGNH/GDSL hydrolase family protein [Verrucomicrobiota bacterium]MBT7064780.1 SGNH/GDSL hydrolase family protein [Verrucomicrobiota bacterium]MBT7700566.1 SGNH/GDSL hydrolase family protein [Verrucomicrobiota bacterium]